MALNIRNVTIWWQWSDWTLKGQSLFCAVRIQGSLTGRCGAVTRSFDQLATHRPSFRDQLTMILQTLTMHTYKTTNSVATISLLPASKAKQSKEVFTKAQADSLYAQVERITQNNKIQLSLVGPWTLLRELFWFGYNSLKSVHMYCIRLTHSEVVMDKCP